MRGLGCILRSELLTDNTSRSANSFKRRMHQRFVSPPADTRPERNRPVGLGEEGVGLVPPFLPNGFFLDPPKRAKQSVV